MRPGRARVDRKARGAIAAHRRPAQILKDRSRLLKVGREFVGGQGEDAPMIIAMAGQFVPRLDDPPNQRGIAFGDPTQGEESAGRSEEHTSELQSLMRISYAVFCLKKKRRRN